MISEKNIADQIYEFTKSSQEKKFKDSDEAMKSYSRGMARIFVEALRSMEITVPQLPVTVAGATGKGFTDKATKAIIQ